MKKILLFLVVLLAVDAVVAEHGPAIQDFQLQDGKFVFYIPYIYNDITIDGKVVDFATNYAGGAAGTVYSVPCRKGNLLELKYANPVSGEITSTSFDLSGYGCAPIVGPSIQNFRIENGKYVFYSSYVYSKIFIDSEEVGFTSEFAGGSAGTTYNVPCKEGSLLKAQYLNPVSERVTETSYDISSYKCSPSTISACSDIPKITDCINTDGCTVLDDGSACVKDNPEKIFADYCELQSITDCIINRGCTLDDFGGRCVVAFPDEMNNPDKIMNFELSEDGYYTFEMAYIYNDFYIDGKKVDLQKGPMGSGAFTWYKIKCQEGKLLHSQTVKNSLTGELGATAIDISGYRCKSCSDSDSKDYFTAGSVTGFGANGDYEFTDSCKDEKILIEYNCESSDYLPIEYGCPYGCQNNACTNFVEPQEKLKVQDEELLSSTECPEKSCRTVSKTCYGADQIEIEECKVSIMKNGVCEEITTSESKVNQNVCAHSETLAEECGGCQLNQNTCIPFGTRLEKNANGYYCSIDHALIAQKADGQSCQNAYECVSNNCKGGICSPICSGCLYAGNVCIPIGTRSDKQYCDSDFSFKEQIAENLACNNNYECASNVCVNDECISPGLLQRIISWFKNWFR